MRPEQRNRAENAEGVERQCSTGVAVGPLDHDAVSTQLDRILASPEFHSTEKMRAFLRFCCCLCC